jgi:hypothetical protein
MPWFVTSALIACDLLGRANVTTSFIPCVGLARPAVLLLATEFEAQATWLVKPNYDPGQQDSRKIAITSSS